MSLPKIDYPLYNIEIPSLKKEFRFRPFLVKEEKLLLMAKESNNNTDILSALKQVVNNCSVDNNFDINKLAVFDLEYIFLKLRSLSVDNKVKLTYIDNEDQKTYNFEIDLNDIKVKFPEKIDNIIKLTENSGIIMKYPPASLYNDEKFLNLEKDHLFELIIRCLDKIYEDDTVIELKDYSHKDLSEFLDNLNIQTFEKIQNFLLSVPKIEYVINYKNSLDNDRKIILNSLNDFFM